MLIQVAVYPSGWKPVISESGHGHAKTSGLEVDQSTCYACLASAKSSNKREGQKGTILTIGRKQADVNFPLDKTVSRQHCSVRVYSTNQSLVENEGGPAKAETSEQILACEKCTERMCVVLENDGKLGSFIIEDVHSQFGNQNNDDDSATEEDETDEEQEVQQTASSSNVDHPNTSLAASQVLVATSNGPVPVSLSLASQRRLKNPMKAAVGWIGPQHKKVLSQLTCPEGNNEEKRRVVIQVGRGGSTIVLTRYTIRFVRSGSNKSRKNSLPDKPLPWEHDNERHLTVGVLEEMDKITEQTTHLLTWKRSPTTKQLTAWSRGIPIVTPNYITDLLYGGQSPIASLPDPNDYQPEADSNKFWSIKPNNSLWQSCTLLSYTDSHKELEELVCSAGARIVQLYGLTEKEVVETVQSCDRGCAFAIAPSDIELRGELFVLLREAGVRQVSSNQIAMCLTEQRPLFDFGPSEKDVTDNLKTNENPPSTGLMSSGGFSSSSVQVLHRQEGVPARESECRLEKPPLKSNALAITEDETNDSISDRQDTECSGLQQPNLKKDAYASGRAFEPTDDASDGNKKRQNIQFNKGRLLDALAMLEKGEQNGSRKEATKTSRGIKETLENGEAADLEAQGSDDMNHSKLSERIKSILQTGNKRSHVETETNLKRPKENCESMEIPQEALPLPRNSYWMEAAPQGKRRKAYRKGTEQIQARTGIATDDEHVLEAAPTDVVKGLIVLDHRNVRAPQKSQASSGPNFKKFRKNYVESNSEVGVPGRTIRMRSVLPRESQHQKELQIQQHALEEQQRRADELFRDPKRTATSRRRTTTKR